MEELRNKYPALEEAHLLGTVVTVSKSSIQALACLNNDPAEDDRLKVIFHCLERILRDSPEITLEAREEGLFCDGDELGDSAMKDFARDFRLRRPISVTFSAGLEREELIAFHKILTINAAAAKEHAENNGDEHIVHVVIRYPHVCSVVDLSDGETLDLIKIIQQSPEPSACEMRGDPQGSGLAGPDAWETCITRLLADDLSGDDREVVRSILPAHMAHLLNAMAIENLNDSVYERIIALYLKEQGEGPSGSSSEREGVFFEWLRPNILSRFRRLLGPPSPPPGDARPQPQPGVVQESAWSSSGGTAAGTGMQAEDGPSICGVEFGSFSDFMGDSNEEIHDIETAKDICSLIDKDRISKFMSRSYQQELGALLRPFEGIASFVQEFSEAALQVRAVDVLLEIINSDHIDGDYFLRMLTRLTQFADSFVDEGKLEEVLEVYNALSSHALEGKYSSHASAALTYFFHSESFITKLVEAFRFWGRKNRESAKRLTRALRKSLMIPLLDALEEEPKVFTRRFLISLLSSIRSDILPLVAERLGDNRWYVRRNMIYLLRECDGKKYIPAVREALKDEMPLVCLEALRTLLSFQAPEAIPYVVRFLQSDSRRIQRGTVRLVGAYRVREAVPRLLAMLNEKDILGTKLSFKKVLLRALGRIGDERAVGRLTEICMSTSLVHKYNLELLKVEIFRTLYKYPLASLEPLLKQGTQSDNPEIVAISLKLLDRYYERVANQWSKDA